jgi:hypothetical protein
LFELSELHVVPPLEEVYTILGVLIDKPTSLVPSDEANIFLHRGTLLGDGDVIVTQVLPLLVDLYRWPLS